jgi:hypothetical protein
LAEQLPEFAPLRRQSFKLCGHHAGCFATSIATEAQGMIRGHRSTLALSTLLVVGAATCAIAAANPTVTSGSVSITGSGTVNVTGQVWVQGALSGPHPLIVIRTTTASASFASPGKSRRIPKGRTVQIPVTPKAYFSIMGTAGTTVVRLRGAQISATVAGTATVRFSGKGTYTPFNGMPTQWPRTALHLVQPTTSTAHFG